MYKPGILTPALALLGLLLSLLSTTAPGQSNEEFLQPQQAYQLSADSDSPDTAILRWKIADGYYLYKSKFRFSSESPGASTAEAQFPPAKIKQDEFFGEMEVYYDQVEIRVPLERSGEQSGSVRLKTISQGCADAGLCYPPQTEYVTLQLAAAPAPPQTAAEESPVPDPLAALATLSGLGQSIGINDEVEILPPDQAYKFTADVESGEQLRLRWQIADGTYLYQDKIQLKLVDGEGVELGQFQLPKAKIKADTIRPDGTIGDIAVYVHDFELPVPLIRSNTDATEIQLQATYQGCAEAGICYPPQTKRVALALPAASSQQPSPPPVTPASSPLQQAMQAVTLPAATPSVSPPANDSEPEVISESDQITATLAGGNTWLIILTFFGFGLLLSLTPCVFPMIPILSGIIAGQGHKVTTGRAFSLSLVYVLSMSITYTAAGVLAGLFGKNLQALFQDPWILSFFALLFVLLALSMFGFYEIQLPSRWQSKLTETSNHQRGGRFGGVAVMGFLSALIVGPCVAPPLAGALIYIGQTGNALLGGIGLFALAMGMGAPLLVIGASAGKLLPRAGGWMDTIKAVFGVGMLAVAIVMLERIVPAAVAMVLWGVLMVTSAIYMGALRELPIEASGWDRLWKGLGVVILIYGTLMLVGAAAGGKDTVQPLRGIAFGGGGGAGGTQLGGELHFKRIKSLDDLQREVATASAAGKPVMLDFVADWCVTCKEMERYTFSDPAVHQALGDFVLLQADVTANDEVDQALLQGHFGLPGPPAIMFYDRSGKEKRGYRVVGYKSADEFAAHIRKAVP